MIAFLSRFMVSSAGEEEELEEAKDLRLREALALELGIQQTREEVITRGNSR